MRHHYVVTFIAALLLSLSCLVPRVMAEDTSGVMMMNGKMMMMKDGKPTGPMEKDMTMSDGTKVMADGAMMAKDGKQMHMKDGQMMLMDGKMMEGGKAMGMDKPMGMTK